MEVGVGNISVNVTFYDTGFPKKEFIYEEAISR